MPRGKRGTTSAITVHTARALRQEMTPAETVLYEALRGRRLGGLKFRRQHPYGRYILDNYCVEKRLERIPNSYVGKRPFGFPKTRKVCPPIRLESALVVEADGAVHDEPDQAAHDQARTEFLTSEGILVLRFPNAVILSNLDSVLKKILEVAKLR
ncbi:MAG: DUF559 domain-containing protein [Chloroflexi bacterium]|nr:DUF559 domain-containing protein [Chloroflexota bacterium]